MKVLISGAFDLLTSGHIFTLKIAKTFGNYLIVNILPDSRVREKKGNERPIKSERERELIMNNIKEVNETRCTKAKLGQTQIEYEQTIVNMIRPDVFISSTDHQEVREFCERLRIKFVVLSEFEGVDKIHTTDIVEKIKKFN